MKYKFLLILFLCSFTAAKSQCTLNPTVTGNLMLCPDSNDSLTTQNFGTYQWYKRDFFGNPAAAIPGATSRTLYINYFDDVLYYFSVEVTEDTCTEMSPEVLVDGYAFGSPYIISSGNFTIGPNGEAILCQGDSITLEFGLPYDTHITWFDGGNPITGAHAQTYIVKTPGSYTVEGAPNVCPNFFQLAGVPVDVTVINCGVGLDEHSLADINIYPNPAQDYISISSINYTKGSLHFRLLSADGKLILEKDFESGDVTIDLNGINTGLYFCELKSGNEIKTQRLNIVR